MKRPSVTSKGTYDPVELIEFLDEACRRGMRPHQISKELNVPVDRIEYALGKGYKNFCRRSEDYFFMKKGSRS